MKRAISILILLILLFFIIQWGIVYFKEDHEVSYKVVNKDTTFDISEVYSKSNGDTYDILIKNNDKKYTYVFDNLYNKQKKIIKAIEYYTSGNDNCIYPVLINNKGSYIECVRDNVAYSGYAFPNQELVNNVKAYLKDKGYTFNESDLSKTEQLGSSTIYTNNLEDNSYITLWNYKGIQIINKKDSDIKTVLSFDKYENNHGYLVDRYYIIPNYLSSKVLEFSTVNVIDLYTKKQEKIDLVYTLSSSTYINGVVDGKLYYTDPSNLLQMEINPKNNKARLIGSKELGGQLYNGTWNNANIYDFVGKRIKYEEKLPEELNKYSYNDIISNKHGYYFYNSNGIYRVSKNNLDVSVLLYKASNINNFNVTNNTVYYVIGNMLYSYDDSRGAISVVKNNDLIYNTVNRIGINRKS